METSSIKQKEIVRDWYIFDAEGQVLGRLASNIAQIIRGKNKPYYTPHMDMGDFVIVINAEKVKVTGNKESGKMYWRHSGYPGGLTEYNLASLRGKHPDRLISKAVKGMLPSNKLGSKLLGHLKVYKGSDHPHVAQNPQKLELK
tara:strand:+ start:531 stop:962 length:432 start_codon:yes stop_codon:yes gene_type:complete